MFSVSEKGGYRFTMYSVVLNNKKTNKRDTRFYCECKKNDNRLYTNLFYFILCMSRCLLIYFIINYYAINCHAFIVKTHPEHLRSPMINGVHVAQSLVV